MAQYNISWSNGAGYENDLSYMLQKGLNDDNDYNLSGRIMSQEMVEYKYSVSNEFRNIFFFFAWNTV